MTAPTFEDITTSAETAYTTSHSYDLPATVAAGDLLIASVSIARKSSAVSPTSSLDDWTLLLDVDLHDYHNWRIYALIAAGDEGDGTIDFTLPSGYRGGCSILRLSGTHPSVADGIALATPSARTWSDTVTVPEVTAPWGSADNLFAAIMSLHLASSSPITVDSYPTNYSNGTASAVAGQGVNAIATRALTAASDDPDTFGLDATGGFMRATTLVIRPADAGFSATPTPTGGLTTGGEATVTFTTTADMGQVSSDVELLVDWDNDGAFDDAVDNVTGDTRWCEAFTGRDFPSQATGRTVPGTLVAELINRGDTYSRFNAASTLFDDGRAIKVGRKVRLQTTGATAPEPTALVTDRFGVAGPVDATEQGEPWALVLGGNDFTNADGATTCAGDGGLVVDTRRTAIYAQARVRHCDADNTIGIIYRYLTDDDYGLITISEGTVTHTVVTAGTPADHGTDTIEMRPHMTFGVLVTDTDDVTVLLEGVPLFTDTGDAHAGGGTGAGIYVLWANHRSPAFEELRVWDGLWSESPGVLFTGDLTDLRPLVTAGPHKTVRLEAKGWLTRLASTDVLPPTSIGVTTESSAGVTTGLMVGQALASAQMLHPPPSGGLGAGTVTLGGVGTGNAKALHIARLFELTELGLLHETPEGPIRFDDRDDRTAKSVLAAISDAAGTQIAPERVELLDWRREIFNRATGEVSPSTPAIEVVLTDTGDHAAGATATITVTLPSTVQATAGDLDLLVVAATCQLANEPIEAPAGWVPVAATGGGTSATREHWFARVLTAGDLAATPETRTFYTASGAGGGAWIARQFIISGWYGAVDGGVALAQPSGEVGTDAQAGTNQPPTLLVPWGRQPGLFLVTRSGLYTASTGSVSVTDPDDAPNGYRDLTSTFVAATGVATADVAQQYAWRHAVAGIESPSPFGGTFTGFDNLESSTIAVRGYAGDPPEPSGGEMVTVDDLDSQAEHNLVATYPQVARFHASAAAADAWCDAVLARHSSERALFRVAFTATKSPLHRWLASTARLSDLLRVVATGGSGIGVNQLCHIESIRHRFTDGMTNWQWDAQLSPSD